MQKGVTLSTAKGKVLCTIVQTLRFCTGCTFRRGLEVYFYFFLTRTLEGVRCQRHGMAALTPGKTQYPS
jgi:hypothetical protein